MNTETFMPDLWSSEIMKSYMKSVWMQVHADKEYSHGIRGTYERERDEAGFSRIVIKSVANRLQRGSRNAGDP